MLESNIGLWKKKEDSMENLIDMFTKLQKVKYHNFHLEREH